MGILRLEYYLEIERTAELEQRSLVEARETIAQIQAHQTAMNAEGRNDALFIPSEQVLLACVDQLTRPFDAAAWTAVLEQSKRFSSEQEPIEVREFYALSLVRSGFTNKGRRELKQAIALAKNIPSLSL